MDLALLELFENHRELTPKPYVARKIRRHSIPVRVSLDILEIDEATPVLRRDGVVRDLSIGGACLLLDGGDSKPRSRRFIGKAVNVVMSPPSGAMTLSIKGTIIWSQIIPIDEGESQALGIQFDVMSPNLSGLLLVFADNLYHAR